MKEDGNRVLFYCELCKNEEVDKLTDIRRYCKCGNYMKHMTNITRDKHV